MTESEIGLGWLENFLVAFSVVNWTVCDFGDINVVLVSCSHLPSEYCTLYRLVLLLSDGTKMNCFKTSRSIKVFLKSCFSYFFTFPSI